jgi:hypothetical protein
MAPGTQIVNFNPSHLAFGLAFALPFDEAAGESIYAGSETLSAAAIKRIDDDDDDFDEDEDDKVEDDEEDDEYDDDDEEDEDEDDDDEDEDDEYDDDEEDADEDEINLI